MIIMIRNNYYDLIELYEDLVNTLVEKHNNPRGILKEHLKERTYSIRTKIEDLREELNFTDPYENY